MAARGHSRFQRLFTGLVNDETAAEMEAQSRAWLMRCEHCGNDRSVWDLGSIRYRASGRQRQMGTCPQCGQTGWQTAVKAPNFPEARGSVWPIVWLVVGMILTIWLVVGAIIFGSLWLAGVI